MSLKHKPEDLKTTSESAEVPKLPMKESFKALKGINASIARPVEMLLKIILSHQGQKATSENKLTLSNKTQIDFLRGEHGNNSALKTPEYRIVQQGADKIEVYDNSENILENNAREMAILKVFNQLSKDNPSIIQEAHLYHIHQRLGDLFKVAKLAISSGQWKSPIEIKSINKNYRFDETKDWRYGRLENDNFAFCNSEGVQLEFKPNGEISVSKDGATLQGKQRSQQLEKFSNCFKHVENAEAKIEAQFDLLLEDNDLIESLSQ